MPWRRGACLTGILVACLGERVHAGGAAMLPEDEAVTEANRLFASGKEHMNGGEVAAACRDFERSLALAPRAGTALNLGLCLERAGRALEAYEVFGKARELIPNGPFREERERMVAEHRSALEARLCKLRVVLAEPPRDVTVTLDGAAWPSDGRDGPLVEARTHRLSVAAPGRKGMDLVIEGLRPGDSRLVEVPELEPEASQVATAEARPRRPTARELAPRGPAGERKESLLVAEGASAPGQERRWYLWIGAGLVLTGLAAGAYVLAQRASSTSDRQTDFHGTFP